MCSLGPTSSSRFKIPGVETMTFCAAQVKNRKHDALNASIKTTAVVYLGKEMDKLEWSQPHRYHDVPPIQNISSNPSKKSNIGSLTESSTASDQVDTILPEKFHDKELAAWPRLAALPTTGVEELVYQSINLCGGERLANDNDVSIFMKKLLDCVLGTIFPDEAEDRVNHLSPF